MCVCLFVLLCCFLLSDNADGLKEEVITTMTCRHWYTFYYGCVLLENNNTTIVLLVNNNTIVVKVLVNNNTVVNKGVLCRCLICQIKCGKIHGNCSRGQEKN